MIFYDYQMPKSINLKFYKNGLIVEGGRLRLYNDSTTKCFIRDILDGYFPSEFQNNYPNGVPLKVTTCNDPDTQCLICTQFSSTSGRRSQEGILLRRWGWFSWSWISVRKSDIFLCKTNYASHKSVQFLARICSSDSCQVE